jgi:hypothetical protein
MKKMAIRITALAAVFIVTPAMLWFGVNRYYENNFHGNDKCYSTFEIVKTK